ncbi:RNA recognition motif domain [Dillenia turbinata]|uniref:RNA recognition motif domain n=1 Tax=Dillenia turbinata TaxID=194707 RepID=A0AAN8YWJ8_9MAGN
MVDSSSSSTPLVKHLPEAIPLDTLSRSPISVLLLFAPALLEGCEYASWTHSSKSLIKETATIRDQSETSKSRPLPPGEPIAPTLGVDFPFPPHLEYAYSPPDGNILTNIVNTLIAVPRFYTQVLHLMNKMNIPAPFCMVLPTPPLPPPLTAPLPPPPPPIEKPHLADLSSDESELDSSDAGLQRKHARREAIIGPAVDKDVVHEAVGLKPAALVPKEVPLIKKKNSVLQIKIAPKLVRSELNVQTKPYATPEEIQNGKLPPEEILSLPKFKNYTAGNPAPVLYIKNLVKDVVADDFHFILGSFFGSLDAAKSSLTIKLMQEGRMKGQAFVTFPYVDLALQALNLVNGYVFKGMPMNIQFGRNPAAMKS